MKDNFSGHAREYAAHRPHYPQELFDLIRSVVPDAAIAWDCATGNGQFATGIAEFCKEVYATDLSAKQLENARQLPNVFYSEQPAERTDFHDNFFDLITVAQAAHWFDFDEFYSEVKRVAKPGAALILIGYGRVITGTDTDPLVEEFYSGTLKEYWDPERKYLDEEYKTIPFPFSEITNPSFSITIEWSLDEFSAYLNTWSAVKHFEKATSRNPVNDLRQCLSDKWTERKSLTFPLYIRFGIIDKNF